MKTNELTRLLQASGCLVWRHGRRHDIWINPETGKKAAVPRHGAKEVNPKTAESILKTLLG